MENKIHDRDITQACHVAVDDEKRVYEADFPIPDLLKFVREREDVIVVQDCDGCDRIALQRIYSICCSEDEGLALQWRAGAGVHRTVRLVDGILGL